MPEGPEIRRAADALTRAVSGRTAVRVHFAFERLRPFERLLAGEEVVAVEPRGKAILTVFANGLVVYSHNQLYGRWYTVRAGTRPRTGRTLRFGIENESRAALLYSASEIEVLDWERLRAHPYLGALGPDALDPSLEASEVEARLDERRFSSRSLAALLLDQGFVAGLGNYLRAEICFVAGIHPARRPRDLAPSARRALAEAILAVARRSYATGGITNDPAHARALREEGVPRRLHRFHVFARDGHPCWRCETPVARGELAGRRVYWCPGCQPG